ncbi:MAG: type I-E CRISPR-associated protein Cse2/CasB [Elusimicrobiota bacterium]
MSNMVEFLEGIAKKESKVRAVLKRSLAFEPGLYPPAFPYVEHRLGSNYDNWKRTVFYLVAGLWSLHRGEVHGQGQTLSSACKAFYFKSNKSSSVEKRFIVLLDADDGQLSHRLRQIVALLKEYPIDFDVLLKDLLSWNHPDKWVQIKWAKEFYKDTDDKENEAETINQKESLK